MRSSLGPLLANIIMTDPEEKVIKPLIMTTQSSFAQDMKITPYV